MANDKSRSQRPGSYEEILTILHGPTIEQNQSENYVEETHRALLHPRLCPIKHNSRRICPCCSDVGLLRLLQRVCKVFNRFRVPLDESSRQDGFQDPDV